MGDWVMGDNGVLRFFLGWKACTFSLIACFSTSAHTYSAEPLLEHLNHFYEVHNTSALGYLSAKGGLLEDRSHEQKLIEDFLRPLSDERRLTELGVLLLKDHRQTFPLPSTGSTPEVGILLGAKLMEWCEAIEHQFSIQHADLRFYDVFNSELKCEPDLNAIVVVGPQVREFLRGFIQVQRTELPFINRRYSLNKESAARVRWVHIDENSRPLDIYLPDYFPQMGRELLSAFETQAGLTYKTSLSFNDLAKPIDYLVYLISGAPVNFPFIGKTLTTMGEIFATEAKNHSKQALVLSVHNSNIHPHRLRKAQFLAKAGVRIVIFGTSWGGSEAVYFSQRIAQDNSPVDLVLTVDIIPKPSTLDSRKVGHTTKHAFNISQGVGAIVLLQGTREIYRIAHEEGVDVTHDGVLNLGVDMKTINFLRAHLKVAERAMPIIETILQEYVSSNAPYVSAAPYPSFVEGPSNPEFDHLVSMIERHFNEIRAQY